MMIQAMVMLRKQQQQYVHHHVHNRRNGLLGTSNMYGRSGDKSVTGVTKTIIDWAMAIQAFTQEGEQPYRLASSARVRSSRLSSSMTSHAIFSTASQFSLDAIMFCTKLLGVGSTPKAAATVLLCLLNLGQSKMTCSASSRCSVPQVLQ
ncbi:hypothetical protein ACLKA6_016739 [Drosophila palustris]